MAGPPAPRGSEASAGTTSGRGAGASAKAAHAAVAAKRGRRSRLSTIRAWYEVCGIMGARMKQRWRRITLAALGASMLPAALALLSSGSCSLAELYSGADAAGEGGSGTGAGTGAGTGGGDAGADAPECPAEMV